MRDSKSMTRRLALPVAAAFTVTALSGGAVLAQDEPAYAGLDKDLFVALGDQLGNGGWSVRIQYKPLIRFIWLGALFMALGGIVAVSDRRYRVNVREKAPAAVSPQEATA